MAVTAAGYRTRARGIDSPGTTRARLRLAVLPAAAPLGFVVYTALGADEPTQSPCPPDMVLVEGRYCTVVRQHCEAWLEPPFLAGDGRCARFASSECVGPRAPMRVCIDRDEYTPPGDSLPMNVASWSDAARICGAGEKRLCRESEWNFACEGEAMLPYPTGYERDARDCNYDRYDLVDAMGRPRDLRQPSAALTACTSPFGVRNMVGNVDEWVVRDVSPGEHRSALKGGWWLPGRNRCRPATTAHGESYRDFQTGFRCCRDPDAEPFARVTAP